MGPETDDISVFVLLLAWACLSLTNRALKNHVLNYIFPSQDIMEIVMLRASFEFASGLLDVLQSRTAPTISLRLSGGSSRSSEGRVQDYTQRLARLDLHTICQ